MRAMRLFGAAALLVTLCASAQQAKTYRIAGVVTNSATGERLAGATVRLAGTTAGDETMRTAQTDADGRFALEPVPAGKYRLSAARRGYLTGAFNEHDGYSSSIVTGEGQDTEHIPFHLDPDATIRCVVTDDAGEPVEGAQVLLARKVNEEGLGEHMQPAGSGQTDDTGLFEYPGLMPGTYFLAVKAEPWFATRIPQQQQNSMDAETRAAMAALDVAYPVTYYDGAMDESAAAPIVVKSGEPVEADVALHAVPALRLTIPEAGQDGGQPRQIPTFRQTTLGEEFGMQAGQVAIEKDGSMELFGIAPGHYTVVEGNSGREVEVDVSGSQALDLSAATPMFEVMIHARMADGSSLPRPLTLTLTGNTTGRSLMRQVNEKGEARVQSVPAGEWNVTAMAETNALGVVSIQTVAAEASATEPHAASSFEVRDRNLTLNLVLAPARTNVEGFAAKDGKNEAGMMIVLVPKNPEARLADFRRDQSDSDGSFSLQNVTPGAYTVVAIEDGWELDWAKPEVIGRFLKGGVPVTVPMNAPAVMKLGGTVVVQEK